MKNTRKSLEPETGGITLNFSRHPGDGVSVLRVVEWENGEGFDFKFPDGTIELTLSELLAVIEGYHCHIRMEMLKAGGHDEDAR